MTVRVAAWLCVGVLSMLLIGSCASDQSQQAGAAGESAARAEVSAGAPVQPPAIDAQQPADYPGLHNVVTYHAGFYSGGAPEGDAGFDTLNEMGVKTIISVDGAAPEVEYAHERGMRYIHLPIAYNGFDEQRRLELVRATRDALKAGPVYIHCHHGKHRSAGAAGTIAASLGWASPKAMVARMKVSGTSPSYTGLYQCTADADVLTPKQINSVPADFPEVSRPQGFVKAMVEVSVVDEHLKAIEQAGWSVPADHPDLVPAAEAGRMVDLFRAMCEGTRASREPADFTEWLREAQRHAQALEDLLAEGSTDIPAMSAEFNGLAQTCRACHAVYRNERPVTR